MPMSAQILFFAKDFEQYPDPQAWAGMSAV
jgi:hypothetical protein